MANTGETWTVSSAKLLPLLSVTTEIFLILLIFWHVYIPLDHHFAFYWEAFKISDFFQEC